MHGMFWGFPDTVSAENTAGIHPLSSYQKIVSDFCDWNDHLYPCIVDYGPFWIYRITPFFNDYARNSSWFFPLWFFQGQD